MVKTIEGQDIKAGRAQRAIVGPLQGTLASHNYIEVYRADPMQRVQWVKGGVPAQAVVELAKQMVMSKERLVGTLGLGRATIDRKVRDRKTLSQDEGSRILGMVRLVGQVQAMVEESGRPEGFDAGAWVARWLEQPVPALGGRRPAEFMDTPEGQGLVSDLVARMQSGAYA
ncbi:antitoxin Xre/MbcA/ParS toxin-binding domain-containing protein [Hydrogenophaga defluvii]|uniref:Antitoxin Xre/MbcA/ParS toxin-binding domain-containing protein n=1 Tax=Hydrogenophaga defluvii TaxID=249410 RepID=A0ABW2SBI5_9BURK